MFNLGRLTADLLNTLDSAAKDSLEEPQISATSLRKAKKQLQGGEGISTSNERNDEDNYDEDSNEEDGDEDDEDDDHVEENDISRSMSISGLIGKGLSTASNLLPGNSGLLSITNMSGKEINTTQSASTSESELRTILKKKNLEIEKLNGECLELEESCTSLKKEVEEAWASYKSSQEKAMLRESELQEEIRMIQKAKSTDKQQLQVQISRMNEDTSELLKRIKSLESERDHAATTFNEMSEQSQLWEQKESEFFSQIEDLKANSVQGTHNLREEYQREKDVNQALRTEHQSILRQNEQTLRELESQNMANIQALSDKEKELISFKVLLSQAGGPKEHQSTLRDLESIRNDYDNLVKLHDESSIKVNQYERRIKQLETEHKVTIIKYEDDRQRSQELLSLTDKKVLELQDKIQTMTENNMNMNMNMSSGTYNGSTDQNTSVNNSNDSVARVPGTSVDMLSTTTTSNMHSKVTQLMEQIQSLSKQLLKKQEQVMELQTEKSVLKSRTTDLLARCSHAEQELTRMKNLEDGRDDDDDDNDNYSNMDSRTSLLSDYRVGLTHRGGAPLGGLVTPSDSPSKARYGDNSSSASKYRRVKGSGKIISELESIGVRPSASVASAVNFVDSLTFITGSRFSDNFNI